MADAAPIDIVHETFGAGGNSPRAANVAYVAHPILAEVKSSGAWMGASETYGACYPEGLRRIEKIRLTRMAQGYAHYRGSASARYRNTTYLIARLGLNSLRHLVPLLHLLSHPIQKLLGGAGTPILRWAQSLGL